jgi:hypothetical protein
MTKFKTEQQQRVYRRLSDLVSPGAASFFKDACNIVEAQPQLESTTHLVGHLLREIESSLRAVLKPIWGLESSKNSEEHKQQILAILKALNISEDEKTAKNWLKLPGKNSEYGLHKHAHRDDLSTPRPVNENFKEFWREIQDVLDQVLDRFETKYSAIRNNLDKILEKQVPEKADLDSLRLNVPNSFSALGYFFQKLQSPGWLQPLNEAGFFNIPPEQGELEPELHWTKHKFWPQSHCLARIAKEGKADPQVLLDILLSMLKTGTRNALIHRDMVEAACYLPPDSAAQWTRELVILLQSQEYISCQDPESYIHLANFLAQNSYVVTAISLIHEMLSVVADSDAGVSYPKARTKLQTIISTGIYDYQKILEKCIPQILRFDYSATLKMLCFLLGEVISFSRKNKNTERCEDASEFWYPQIQVNKKNSRYRNLRESLTDTILESIQRIGEENLAEMTCILEILNSYHWQIFKRISIHLFQNNLSNLQEFLEDYLLDKDQILTPCYEYKLLLQEQFQSLSLDKQMTILAWIDEGPKLIIKKDSDSEEQKARLNHYVKCWQRNRLSLISNNLPEGWGLRYDALIHEVGDAEPLAPKRSSDFQLKDDSPKTYEELNAMPLTELFGFLETWQPSETTPHPFVSPIYDLGQKLRKVIEAKPFPFLDLIHRFRSLRIEYKCAFIQGIRALLQSTIPENQVFPWCKVLEFCVDFFEVEFKQYKSRVNEEEFDADWNLTCRNIVDLLKDGFSKGLDSNSIPFDYRVQVWKILEFCTSDPGLAPGLQLSNSQWGSSLESEALNTVRPTAFEAVIQYAFWVKRSLGAINAEGCIAMPEVKKLLDKHLDPAQDTSRVIRFIYGQPKYRTKIEEIVESYHHSWEKD